GWMKTGEYDAARNELKKAILTSPRMITAETAYYYLAVCDVKLGAWVEAEHSLDEFDRLHPGTVEASYIRAYLFFRTGRYKQALPLITRYVQEDPYHWEARKFLGLTEFMLGMTDAAADELKRANQM